MKEEKPSTLLIVDDAVEFQRALKRAAEAAGFVVTQAFDGGAGLATATEKPFDLILLDINMPVMDGRDVLKRLKQNPVTAGVPVLVCSSRDGQYDRFTAVELGAEDYVEKPVDPAMLMMTIRRLIVTARERKSR